MDVDLEGFFLRPMQADDDPKKFSLGNPAFTPLKTFLINDAWSFHQYQIAKTFVLIRSGSSRIWGYISLTNSEASLEQGQRPEAPERAARYPTFPAVKIARLAIDKSIQGNQFGRILLDWAVNHIRTTIMPHVGCRFVVVDSKPTSVSFYQRACFILVKPASETGDECPMLFYDLAKDENHSIQEVIQKGITEVAQSVG